MITCGDHVALVILKCIAIEEKSMRTTSVDDQSLSFPASGIKLIGQVLEMVEVGLCLPASEKMGPASNEDPNFSQTSTLTDTPAPDNSSLAGPDWLWNGNFVKLDLVMAKTAPTGKFACKMIVIKVCSYLCEPISPHIFTAVHRLPSTELVKLNGLSLTWELSNEELYTIITALWGTIQSHQALALLPKFKSSNSFPYRNAQGEATLISDQASAEVEATCMHKNQKFRCYQCLSIVEQRKICSHIGKHILKMLRGIPEVLQGSPVSLRTFCGCLHYNLMFM
ncbi:hypothetical protein SCP_0502290 [Sparassis crispa]|uniref:Uncharacterized protein n=1 Tax=Sparassis crispa TaxID=139825 RepID=A0A401GLY1_9APHY|nr:hypothetical protein SCP_0502290 [Sparassis crispa]GBE83182.1 hypothetical protein SCP_0502290 [Sparassis crispa]